MLICRAFCTARRRAGFDVRVGAAGLDGHDDFLGNARELLGHAVPARKHRVLSNFEDTSHGRKVWQMTGTAAIHRAHLVARFDAERSGDARRARRRFEYERVVGRRPAGARARGLGAAAVRDRLVIVQDDVNALAVRDTARRRASRVVAGARFGQASVRRHAREQTRQARPRSLRDAYPTAASLHSARARRQRASSWSFGMGASRRRSSTRARCIASCARLWCSDDGAAQRRRRRRRASSRLKLFHRGNDARDAARAHRGMRSRSSSCDEFVGVARAARRRAESAHQSSVTTVDLGEVRGVPFGFTDAVALDRERVVVLACAEDSACAISDGAVLGLPSRAARRAGSEDVDVYDATGERTLLKLEGIERRAGSRTRVRRRRRRRSPGGAGAARPPRVGVAIAHGTAARERRQEAAARGLRIGRLWPSARTRRAMGEDGSGARPASCRLTRARRRVPRAVLPP